VRYLESALKHGVTVEDIAHVLRLPLRLAALDESRTLILGPDQAGRLLEIVAADVDGDDPRVIHAMPIRPKFHHYLRGHRP
jgi:uncharacterized DUF497 family protein